MALTDWACHKSWLPPSRLRTCWLQFSRLHRRPTRLSFQSCNFVGSGHQLHLCRRWFLHLGAAHSLLKEFIPPSLISFLESSLIWTSVSALLPLSNGSYQEPRSVLGSISKSLPFSYQGSKSKFLQSFCSFPYLSSSSAFSGTLESSQSEFRCSDYGGLALLYQGWTALTCILGHLALSAVTERLSWLQWSTAADASISPSFCSSPPLFSLACSSC